MKVSVLVPVFNAERFLAECLESILAQDFTGFEIIIADDNSTDGSAEIIKQFASRDSRIVWWTNSQNLGEAANCNAGLKAAQGEYIKVVHADDKLLSPSAIGKMVAALDANPAASLLACRQHFTKTDPTSKLEPHIFSDKSGCFNGRQVIVECLEKDGNLIGNPTVTLFRRSQAQRGFDTRFKNMVDWEMWFHLLEQGDFVYLAETLATWRLHGKQQSSSKYRDDDLLLTQIYYDKPWLQAAATKRMLFIQSRSLAKKHGSEAADLVRKMRASLPTTSFLALWLERKLQKISRSADKRISRRFRRQPRPA
ncbi:MAG TPA: glycosyltransferase family 2 protein [Verrucomicrobiae bacterium]|nr:glycosyltransferase family 2 protein [Verrucomicrobiae bacterium]